MTNSHTPLLHAPQTKQKLVNKAFDDVGAAQKRVTSQQGRVEGLRGDPAKAQKLAEAQASLHEAEGKLTAATAKHTELEAAQFELVRALNTEAAGLAGAVRAALEHVGLALLAARDALGPEPAAPAAAPEVNGAAA